jgi:hypothetical protein
MRDKRCEMTGGVGERGFEIVPAGRGSTRAFERVVFDSSGIITFVESGEIYRLSIYIGLKGAVTADVHRELMRKSQTGIPDLVALLNLGWPSGEPLVLPTGRIQEELRDVQKATLMEGDHPEKNLGEFSTALMTQLLGDAVSIIDDREGKSFCRARNIPRMSTGQLAAEMVAADALDEESGFRVFDLATPPQAGYDEFVRAVAKARDALASGP